MTDDERAQLIEDVKRSNKMRADIIERAELAPDFDIAAAWEEVEELDASINTRVVASRAQN